MGVRVRVMAWIAAAAAVLGLSGCGYNDFQRLDEQVKAGLVARCSTSTSGAPT